MPCQFESSDHAALARCLIRPVLRGGNLGPLPQQLPDVLAGLIDQLIDISTEKVRQYLADHAISEADVGGSVEPGVTKAHYLVIHDTSSPEITASSFPANINEKEWSGNKLANWLNSATPTHVFVNRAGQSGTKTNFNTTVGATKFEAGRDLPAGPARQQARERRRGQFLHIELIQPRRRSNPNSSYFDVAPSPGFSPAQLERLALLYVVASVRSGRWLSPAFHCCVDDSIPDAHDDPQNFELEAWLNKIQQLVEALRSA